MIQKIEEARQIKGKKRFYLNVIARVRIVTNKEGKDEIRKNSN
jgi:hypothetical protein